MQNINTNPADHSYLLSKMREKPFRIRFIKTKTKEVRDWSNVVFDEECLRNTYEDRFLVKVKDSNGTTNLPKCIRWDRVVELDFGDQIIAFSTDEEIEERDRSLQ